MWYGHLKRMNEERIPLKVWKWRPKRNRKRGRPRKTWKENIEEAMQKETLQKMHGKIKSNGGLTAINDLALYFKSLIYKIILKL